MLATLRHPGIVQVYDYGEDDLPGGGRAAFLVMEFVDGQPLSERIRTAGRLSVAETLRIVTQAAQALHAAHRGGIVHRDVKPSNLLVQANGAVRLLDFGVARSVNITSITSANAVPGTALYMAPEQAAGKPVSAATDIYALGAVAYQCVAGEPPFTGDSPLQVAVKHLHEEPPPLPADVPAPVAALIGRALAKKPADRYPDARAFAAAARTVAKGGELTAAPATTVTTGATAPTAVTPRPAGPRRAANTVPDNPVLAPPGQGAARSRRRGLALASVAAVVGLATATVATLLALAPSGGTPDDGGTPSVSASPSLSAEPTASASTESSTSPGSRRPDRPDNRRTPERTPSASPSPNPGPDTEPSAEPSGSAEPTESEPTPTQTTPGGSPTQTPNDPAIG